MLLFEIFFFGITAIFLVIATYTDLRERIVHDKLNYGMLGIGIAAHALLAFFYSDIMILGYCIAAIIIALVFSWLLWKAGVWAGGDVKLFLAIAALNPFNPNIAGNLGLLQFDLLKNIQLPIFVVTLFVFSVFAMLPYGAFISAKRLAKNPEIKKEFFVDLKKKIFSAAEFSAFAVGLGGLLVFLQVSVWLELPFIFLFGFFKWKKTRIIISLALVVFALWQDFSESIKWLAYALVLLMGFFLLFRLYFLSKKLLRKKISVEKLEEGMIVSETLLETGKGIEKAPVFEIKKVINHLIHNKSGEIQKILNPKGRVIVSSAQAAGLFPEQIKELQKLAGEKKIPEEIEIRESTAFVPAVLIAFIALNIAGDLLWNIVFAL